MIRLATTSDANEIQLIYTPYVQNTSFTFETEIPTVQQIAERIAKNTARYPWLVCEIQGRIAGYAYASLHRERAAYQWSCECSVYLHEEFKRRGIGVVLYDALFDVLKLQGIRNVYAAITLPNEASIRLHEKCGFQWFATFEKVGYKLQGWKNVGWYQLRLNEFKPEPAPPKWLPEISPELLAGILQKATGSLQQKLTDSYTG